MPVLMATSGVCSFCRNFVKLCGVPGFWENVLDNFSRFNNETACSNFTFCDAFTLSISSKRAHPWDSRNFKVTISGQKNFILFLGFVMLNVTFPIKCFWTSIPTTTKVCWVSWPLLCDSMDSISLKMDKHFTTKFRQKLELKKVYWPSDRLDRTIGGDLCKAVEI